MTGLQVPATGTDAMPAAMIRTIGGRITFWSRGMEERYGFSAREAFGQVSHQLLQTRSWQALDEIEATLVQRRTWHGGLIHLRADGQPVVAANHWRLHHDAGSHGALVTELHADILPPGSEAGGHLADVIAALAQEVSQPLTAVGSYIGGAQRTLRAPSPDMARLEAGVAAAIAQVADAGAILSRFRRLGDNLRSPRERDLRGRLATALERADTVIRDAAQARLEAGRIHTKVQLSRQSREDARRQQAADSPALSSRRAAAQENVAFLQRLLRQDIGLDTQIEPTIRQMLEEAEAHLAALDR